MEVADIIIVRRLSLYKANATSDLAKLGEFNLSTEESGLFASTHYLHFPVLTNSDGTVWDHGSRFLLNKAQTFVFGKPLSSATLKSNAKDLIDFKRFCDTEKIDYLSAKNRITAPTYRYRFYLEAHGAAGDTPKRPISPNTIGRKMNLVCAFYEWLIEDGIEFNTPLWVTTYKKIFYSDGRGYGHQKVVKQRDVASTRSTRSKAHIVSTISDGGELKPLTQIQQKAIINSLLQINNIEMLLAFLIALCTGARIQTVFTLRTYQFSTARHNNQTEIAIKVGHGTDTDTKYSKRGTLFFPAWLYDKVRFYTQSERYIRRSKNSLHVMNDSPNSNYVFLTSHKRPYYIAKNDPLISQYRSPPTGEAVRTFLYGDCKKKLKENGHNFSFKFHDLRASFGMNLVGYFKPRIDSRERSYLEVLDYIRRRMGHESRSTTEQYLEYDQLNELAIEAQIGFENYLESFLELQMHG